MIGAGVLLFLLSLVVSERFLDDLMFLGEGVGLNRCPRVLVRLLLVRFVTGIGLAATVVVIGLNSLSSCLSEHGHIPGFCTDLVGIQHLCFDAFASFSALKGGVLLVSGFTFLVVLASLILRFRRHKNLDWDSSSLEVSTGDKMNNLVPILRDVRSAGGCRVEGLFNQVILVPPDFEQRFSTFERDAALKHEIGHVVGRDPWIHQLALLYRNVFFFLPGPKRFLASLRVALEERADDWAVREGAAIPDALARSILKATRGPEASIALSLAGASSEGIRRRILRLTGKPLPPPKVSFMAGARVLTVLAFFGTGWLQLHCLVEALVWSQ